MCIADSSPTIPVCRPPSGRAISLHWAGASRCSVLLSRRPGSLHPTWTAWPMGKHGTATSPTPQVRALIMRVNITLLIASGGKADIAASCRAAGQAACTTPMGKHGTATFLTPQVKRLDPAVADWQKAVSAEQAAKWVLLQNAERGARKACST